MSAIGKGKSIRTDTCVSCERDFQEDQLDLVPFTKTGKWRCYVHHVSQVWQEK